MKTISFLLLTLFLSNSAAAVTCQCTFYFTVVGTDHTREYTAPSVYCPSAERNHHLVCDGDFSHPQLETFCYNRITGEENTNGDMSVYNVDLDYISCSKR